MGAVAVFGRDYKMKDKPTKTQIRLTLEAKQVVYLASGYSDASCSVWVRNYKDGRNPLIFPKYGMWKSFDEIKDALIKEINLKYPPVAFPFLRLGRITLYGRNDGDKEYLYDMGDFSESEKTKPKKRGVK